MHKKNVIAFQEMINNLSLFIDQCLIQVSLARKFIRTYKCFNQPVKVHQKA